MEKVVVYMATRNLYEALRGSLNSLLANTKVDKVYALIEDDTLPYALPDFVYCIRMDPTKWFAPDGPNYNSQWTYAILLRTALSQILTEDQVLVLDCDTIIQKDLSALWDAPLSKYEYLAAGRKFNTVADGTIYINSAVLMLNLKALRNYHMDQMLIDSLNAQYYEMPEQDCFTQLCQGHIRILPKSYNTPVDMYDTDPAAHILHYAQWIHDGVEDPPMLRYEQCPAMLYWRKKGVIQ